MQKKHKLHLFSCNTTPMKNYENYNFNMCSMTCHELKRFQNYTNVRIHALKSTVWKVVLNLELGSNEFMHIFFLSNLLDWIIYPSKFKKCLCYIRN